MKRKQPEPGPSEFTLKMSTTNPGATYKEFFVSEYPFWICTGSNDKQCPIIAAGMRVVTGNNDELSQEDVNKSAKKYEYKCEWLKSGKCANPFGTTECPTGKLDENNIRQTSSICEFPAPP